MVKRRKTRVVKIDGVKIGGKAPVSIQSMAKTKTGDIQATINQIKGLERAGCEIVRVAVKNREDVAALKKIKRSINIPLVADIHFNYRLALGAISGGVDAIRLNPGNINKRCELKEIVEEAKRAGIPIRIGVNSGSLKGTRPRSNEADLMVESALTFIKYFERLNFRDIIVSLKSSDVLSTVSAYRKMADASSYPLHLGVTATGLKEDGIIKSAIGIGALLSEGIGDTIRVSLTSDPILEVEAAKSILQSLGLRTFGPEIISCPTCGRCQVDIGSIVERLKESVKSKAPMTIAVMGCEVNGPGEAKDAYVGIAAGRGSGVLFKEGKIIKRIKEKDFVKEIEDSL